MEFSAGSNDNVVYLRECLRFALDVAESIFYTTDFWVKDCWALTHSTFTVYITLLKF